MLLDRLLTARVSAPDPKHSYSIMLPRKSTAGIKMSEDQAMTYGPVFAATKVITETVAMLPWRAFELDGEERTLLAGSRLDIVLHRKPNPEMTAFNFREYILTSALLWGNGYAEIERNMLGEVVALWPIHPGRVEIDRTDRGSLFYRIHAHDGSRAVELSPRQIFHVRGPTFDGIVGRSMISFARESWGLGIAAEQFGAAHFGNGGVPAVVVKETAPAKEPMSPEAQSNFIASMMRRFSGSAKAGKWGFVEQGYDIEPVGIPHKDAQFIESRKFQVTEVARWFRLPPHKIGDMEKATFSNIEQQAIDFVVDSIQPWAERLEQEADSKLHDDENVITKVNMNGLLRGDSQARAEHYNKLWNIGVYSINDIRRMEDLNPVEGGDQRFVPLNMVPLDMANEGRQPQNAGAGMVRGVLVDAHQRMLKKEANAVQRASSSNKDMVTWAQSFYARHREQLIESLTPGAQAVAEIWGFNEELIEPMLEAHCDRHIEQSMRDIADGSWSDWNKRAEEGADKLLTRLAGAPKC